MVKKSAAAAPGSAKADGAVKSKAALKKEAALALEELAGATSLVTITATGGMTYQGYVRPVGPPAALPRSPGPSWKFNLPNGTYLFNVNIAAVAGVTVTFTLAGATGTTATNLKMPGTPGQVAGRNFEFGFTAP